MLILRPSAGTSGSTPPFLALQPFPRLPLPPEDPSPCGGSEAGASERPAPAPGPQSSQQGTVIQSSPGRAPPRPPRSPAHPRSPSSALASGLRIPSCPPSPVNLTHQGPPGLRGESRNPSQPRRARSALNFGGGSSGTGGDRGTTARNWCADNCHLWNRWPGGDPGF